MSLTRVRSRSIRAVEYHERAHALVLVFTNGYRYRYLGVPKGVFDDFMLAPSKGRYFNARIRERFVAFRI